MVWLWTLSAMERNWKTPLLALVCCLGAGCSVPTEVYVIPHSFIGWVVVVVDNPKCTAADHVGKKTLIYIQDDGFSCTSTVLTNRTVYREYRSGSGEGAQLPVGIPSKGGLIWSETRVSEARRDGALLLKFIEFFVGPEELSKTPGTHADPLRRAVTHGIIPESAIK